MTLSSAAKWLLLIPLVGAVLAGCGAIEPAPQVVSHASVTFLVTVPSDTPSDALITVVGSHASMGADTAPGLVLRRQGAGVYSGLVRLPVGAEVSFDVWQGDVWRPELSAEGASMSRHTFTVEEGDMTVPVTVARWGTPSMGPR